MTAGPSPHQQLARMLQRSRSRWRTRRALEGAAVVVMAVAVATALAIAIMDQSRFDEQVIGAVRLGLMVLMAGATALFVLMPLFTPMGDRALVRHLEDQVPELDALLVSAVDPPVAGTLGDDDRSESLQRALMAQAARVLDDSSAAIVEQSRARRALLALLCMSALFMVLFSAGPVTVRHGLAVLFAPGGEEAARNPYRLAVEPGDVVLLAGSDLRIQARVEGFEPEALSLYTMARGGSGWQQVELVDAGIGVFESYLFDVREPLRYQVAARDLRSPVYSVQVTPRPVVERIDLRYHYPERTGRAPRDVTGGSDIDAVAGTRVTLRITPDHPTVQGQLILDGERSVPLVGEEGVLRGDVQVMRDGRYRVEFLVPGHGMVRASPEHAITARVDTLPTLALVSPGRDVKVTRIEEVAIAARADDDVAVRDLQLVMSVNGGAEEVLALGDPLTPAPSVEGELELLLEERELAPGDLIAYYLRARDAEDEAREVRSDIYFMDVRPFDMSYRPGRGGGGGGGQGGGDQDLSAQQRSLVVALFELERDRLALGEELAAERVQLLGEAQQRIRIRTDAIVRRLGNRGIVSLNPGYRRMAKELPEAARAMQEVEAMLAVNDVERALPAAHTALLHLQRADAAMREVQVNRSRRGGGGGDSENDLSNLFALEMDRFRNRYEDLKRGNWGEQNRDLDDTLRKLKELAERQLAEIERARTARDAAGDAQKALADEVEKLVRELQRLTRRRPDSQELKDSLRELTDAAAAMRRAAGSNGEAAARQEALRKLRAAREQLDGEAAGRLKRRVADAGRQAGAMQDAQERIARAVQRMRGEGARSDPPSDRSGAARPGQPSGEHGGQPSAARRSPDQGQGQEQGQGESRGQGDGTGQSAGGSDDSAQSVAEIIAGKRSLSAQVREMEALLDRLSVQARQEAQDETSRSLKDAADALREQLTGDRLRRSAERLGRDPASTDPMEEAEIARALSALRQQLDAASRVAESGTVRAARLLERLRGSMRGVDCSRERLSDSARSAGSRQPGDGGGRATQGGPGPGGGAADRDLTHMREAFAARDAEILSLAEALEGEEDFRGELSDVLSALEGVRKAQAGNAEILALRHAALLSAMQALELRLRAQVEEEAVASAAAPRSEALPQQRQQAEAYYRNLSEGLPLR